MFGLAVFRSAFAVSATLGMLWALLALSAYAAAQPDALATPNSDTTQLLPGSYAFRASSASGDGVASAADRLRQSVALPAWWETAAFCLAGGGALAASVATALRVRIAVYQRRARTLEALAAQRTAEITALLDATKSVSAVLELDQLLALILQQLRTVVEYDSASVLELAGDRLVVRAIASSQAVAPSGALQPADSDQLQQLVAGGQPLYIRDFRASSAELRRLLAQALSIPAERLLAAVGCLLVTPLVSKGAVIGALFMARRQVASYTERDRDLAQAFANQTAYAVANARLYEQAQQMAAAAERQRINRELHDSLSQTLFAMKVTLLGLLATPDQDADKMRARAADLKELVARADSEMRALLADARPHRERLISTSLTELIEELGQGLRQREQCELDLRLEQVPVFAANIQIAYYYIAQEAIANSFHHAGAQAIRVRLSLQDGLLALTVCDDGSGFDPAQRQPGHFGLITMRERADSIGARFSLTSQPGAGTEISVTRYIAESEIASQEKRA